jgi:hypothetical protein
MKVKIYICGLIFILSLASCQDEENIDIAKILELKGIWKIEQVYANDHWGGPLYWRTTDWEKQIKFTSNSYYEKITGDFELIGTYRIISDGQIEITWDKPIVTEYPKYRLDYSFDTDGRLTLFKNQYEGVVGEKYEPY